MFRRGPPKNAETRSEAHHIDAGRTEVYVTQVGLDQAGFPRFYQRDAPTFAATTRAGYPRAQALVNVPVSMDSEHRGASQ